MTQDNPRSFSQDTDVISTGQWVTLVHTHNKVGEGSQTVSSWLNLESKSGTTCKKFIAEKIMSTKVASSLFLNKQQTTPGNVISCICLQGQPAYFAFVLECKFAVCVKGFPCD